MEVYEITSHYPNGEKFGLVSDTRRSANSIIANIAESHGRYYFLDKIRVLYIARGEVEEVRSHLEVAFGVNYLTQEVYKKLDLEYQGLLIGLNEYINSIFKEKNKT